MIALIGQWSYAVAAVLFGLLALWQLASAGRRPAMAILGFAFLLTAFWSALAAILGPEAVLTRLGETVRNLGFLTFMFALLRRGLGDDQRPFIGLIYVALFGVVLIQLLADATLGLILPGPQFLAVAQTSITILDLSFTIGALLLVHALYTAAAPEARWGIRLTMTALAAMWAYDLNLYTFVWLTEQPMAELVSLRGVLLIGLLPSFALAMRRNSEWKMKLSRKVTFRSLSILAIATYFLAMFFASEAIELYAGNRGTMIQVIFVFLMSAAAVTLLPSPKVRGWLRVKMAKHLFEHRYDYRTEWIRFNSTLSSSGVDALPLDQRVVQAIAEITEAQGGLLLVRNSQDCLHPTTRWNWDDVGPTHSTPNGDLCNWLEASGHIAELDALRRGDHGDPSEIATLVPEWMISQSQAWALVPLIHSDRLLGAVLLKRPRIDRTLDWEDLDLLRIAGRQVASYLAEAKGQEALSEARRFDEFNRRFAFILHDIKNLVSQLSLVARNAERHADNPEFQEDMVATLQDSVGKMNDLLARLAPKDRSRGEAPRPVGVRQLVQSVAGQKNTGHAVEIDDGEECYALADQPRLETALSHIIQNAIDASPADSPVRISVDRSKGSARIVVADNGSGMSGDFMRTELFRPFSSSKTGGFGIGAFEARTLVAEMGGRLEVESTPEKGSAFVIFLPLAPATQLKASA